MFKTSKYKNEIAKLKSRINDLEDANKQLRNELDVANMRISYESDRRLQDTIDSINKLNANNDSNRLNELMMVLEQVKSLNIWLLFDLDQAIKNENNEHTSMEPFNSIKSFATFMKVLIEHQQKYIVSHLYGTTCDDIISKDEEGK